MLLIYRELNIKLTYQCKLVNHINIIMSSFCFLSVQTVNFCGHIARYGQWSLHPLRFASPPFRGGAQPLSANILPSK